MHTENDTTRVEAFIRTYRTRLALAGGAILTVLLYVAWHVVSRIVGIESTNLDACVMGLSAAAGSIAALAFYWGAE